MELWPHQERVFELLSSGKNVVLQAPTGSGKTRAALYPLLRSLDQHDSTAGKLPRKCIYSVPMRVLAKQFYAEYQETVDKYNLKFGLNISRAIQTGEQSQDPRLAANLVFATIDQTLSSFLLAPYGLPRRHANMNAAAVMSAYLVFDEFHLYDPDSTLPTTLHMLRLLNGITPFILMTATFSDTMLGDLGKLLNAVVVPGTTEERTQLQNLESQQKIRRYHVVTERPLSAEAVFEQHKGRSIVICNIVDRARQLYEALCDANTGSTEIVLLHSRFLPDDRNATEDRIRDVFGKDKQGGDYIVVATQAIEVGVDITSTALHTELAPANAILQRAGRCARYEGNEGDVYIYQHSQRDGEVVDLLENPQPYVSQRDEFVSTLAAFQERDGSEIRFRDEQAIISTVHGPRDQETLNRIKVERYDHRREMFAIMRGSGLADVRNKVRNVVQQQIMIHDDPDLLLDSPFDAPSFGLHPGTLQSYVTDWLERYHASDDIPWAVKWLKEEEDPDNPNRSIYCWIKVHDNPKEVLGAKLVVVHPDLATYDEKLGFLADRGGSWIARLPAKERQRESYNKVYRLETYETHIQHVYEAAFGHNGFWNEMADLAERLERVYGWEADSIRRAAELSVLLHDVGKLSKNWQQWAWNYQLAVSQFDDDISLTPEPGKAYAHTTVENDKYRDIERNTKPRRPWHSVEGAVASAPILANVFGGDHPLFYAVFSAIARHHAPYSDTNQAFRLIDNADKHIRQTLGTRSIEILLAGQSAEIEADCGADELITQPELKSWQQFVAYSLLVRVLRLADQAGTMVGAKG